MRVHPDGAPRTKDIAATAGRRADIGAFAPEQCKGKIVLARMLGLSMLLAASGAAPAATIEGRIVLFSDGKPLRAEEAADAVVYFRPTNPGPVAAAPKPYTMTTQRKQFVPRILPVTVGSTVEFPNQDPILHNAFSTSKDNAFDIGLYGQGEGKAQKFDHAGYVRVYCNVHHSMVGHILVLDTPHFAHPDAQGAFTLKDLPAGKGDLVVWFDRATPWHREVTLDKAATGKGDEAVEVKLELAQKKIPPHMNKFGKPYGRSSDGGY